LIDRSTVIGSNSVVPDLPHPCKSLAVTLQQGGEIGKIRGKGNAVELKDNGFLHLLEKPGDCADWSNAEALVHITVEALDLTGPVDLVLDHRAGGSYLVSFAVAFGVGAVAGHEHTRGRYWTYGVDHLAQDVGAAPGD